MQLIISVTHSLAQWLKLDLPRLPTKDGSRIGTQPLHTDTQQVAWQCHVIRHGNLHAPHHTILAMEAYSRYVMLLPFAQPPSHIELEQTLLARWGNEALHLALNSGAINDDELALMVDAFTHQGCHSHWVLNTDLSIQAHISDVASALQTSLQEDDLEFLDENQCYSFGSYLNQFAKKVGGPNKAEFRPVVRFLTETLYRFGEGLSEREYPNTKVGNFPCPYPKPAAESNVVQLADYRK